MLDFSLFRWYYIGVCRMEWYKYVLLRDITVG
jgi:hypothetical protein